MTACKTTGPQLKQQYWDSSAGYMNPDERPLKDPQSPESREIGEQMEQIVDSGFDGDLISSMVSDGPRVVGVQCQDDQDDVLRMAFRTHPGSGEKDPRYTTSLKNWPNPSKGCTPVQDISSAEADRLMASQNISIRNANSTEKKTLGAALKWLHYLNGGPLTSGKWTGRKPYPFIIRSGVASSGQRADHIQIKKKHSRSVAQYVHEYGHFIGNRGGYAAYRSYMGGSGKCVVSNYAKKNNNEQFCEVFTAFATEPDILLNNSRTPSACKKAFKFFKNKFFKKGDRVHQCMRISQK